MLTTLLVALTPGLLVLLLAPALLAALLVLLAEALLILLAELALLAQRAGRHRIAVNVDEDLLPVWRTRLQDVFIHTLDLLEAGLTQRVLDLLALLALLAHLAELLALLAKALLVLLTEALLVLLAETLLVLLAELLTRLAELLARLTRLPLTVTILVLLAELTRLAELLSLAGLAGLPLTIAILVLLAELLARLAELLLPALPLAILVALGESSRRSPDHHGGGERENGLACHRISSVICTWSWAPRLGAGSTPLNKSGTAT
jgi:hypothetical protein